VANPHPIRVLVVDDSEDFRRTLQSYLGNIPHTQIVGEATDGREAMFMVEKLKPTVVLMDIHIPALDGIAATREIKHTYPHVAILGLSIGPEGYQVYAMVRAGAFEVVAKEKIGEQLPAALERAVASLSAEGEDSRSQ